jgi:hypothetical protein
MNVIDDTVVSHLRHFDLRRRSQDRLHDGNLNLRILF